MADGSTRQFSIPREKDLQLRTISNQGGLSVSFLENGTVFAIDHDDGKDRITLNQVLGSPVHGGIGRLYLRAGGANPFVRELVGPGAKGRFAASGSSAVWQSEAGGITYRVRLALHPSEALWFWQVELSGSGPTQPCDLVLIQDVGLGSRGFLMNSEAYVSQYLDHHVEHHETFGPVLMSRQNLSQGGKFPWLAQGCVTGAKGFATDAIQVLGPDYRMTGLFAAAFGTDLPSQRRQHEVGCIALQSNPVSVGQGASAEITFFGLLSPDHRAASGPADLPVAVAAAARAGETGTDTPSPAEPARSLVQDAAPLVALPLEAGEIAALYPERRAEETQDGTLLSFFVPEGEQNRHVVLSAKEAQVPRRHGALLRSGASMRLDDATLCSTAWMHGVFGAQLTIGNTSFHKLFSVSRDPYNITRGSGLRILVDQGEGWKLLGVPSAFDIGLSDARWIYRLPGRTVTVHAVAAGDAPAMQWRVTVDGAPCRFLVFGHVVMGERDYEQTGTVTIDAAAKRISLTPGADWLWGQTYQQAAYHLVTSTPSAVEAVGGDELLYVDGQARGGAYVALRSQATNELAFAVTGSMTSAAEAERLAARFAAGPDAESLLAPARAFWSLLTRDLRLRGSGPDVEAQDLFLPWLAHDAMMHLTVPHGLEQYTGAAWGTRDVCQGPVELMLALEHDAEVRHILLTLFGEQSQSRGDWPQWFMLEPYPYIRAGDSHGDVIVWPLKALCDYVEATGDLTVLDAETPWRDDKNAATPTRSTLSSHVDKLLETVTASFIPGTHLVRYGEGDWNDSLQPADPHLRDWMVSSWTVALLYEQVVRYSSILKRRGETARSAELSDLAARMRGDFNQHLIRDGVVAGYGLFDHAIFGEAEAAPGETDIAPVDAKSGGVELLLHPSDTRTGLSYSLISMTQPIIGGLFTQTQARHHLKLIEEHLLLPDGAHLMDRPVVYNGGPEKLFRRAESSSFFGREIGLMYVHAHLRYCEALAKLGEAQKAWEGLALINPIAVTQHLPNASLRQRNTYFSSSDAAFPDRYVASAEWGRVRTGTIDVDGGWRIYSSGPGLFTRAIVEQVLGKRRHFGVREENAMTIAGLTGSRSNLV
ncbi:GH36-type glycosyl hydrolase domain-containing protein [Labrys sedimenti]|uniref:GH36-type glycosyl hydrolase domain-containing protein n=1 Tax=Labrys sedimenti TaxID=3106036 RepID=UPI002ACA2C73|nr:cellobiose phosphorylase [Labrys sp. ZIDIC5]MDZ5453874.1 cellobiose phosphorylase [Labrys sp. ZIDIC5]